VGGTQNESYSKRVALTSWARVSSTGTWKGWEKNWQKENEVIILTVGKSYLKKIFFYYKLFPTYTQSGRIVKGNLMYLFIIQPNDYNISSKKRLF